MIHEKTHLLVKQNRKTHFPENMYRTREPIRDLVDFSKHIYRAREPIRDLEKFKFSRFEKLKIIVSLQKCRGVVPTFAFYYVPLKIRNCLHNL